VPIDYQRGEHWASPPLATGRTRPMTPILVMATCRRLSPSLSPPTYQKGQAPFHPTALPHLPPAPSLRWFRPPAVPSTVHSTRRARLQLELVVELEPSRSLLAFRAVEKPTSAPGGRDEEGWRWRSTR
jgi:hypothetical protein